MHSAVLHLSMKNLTFCLCILDPGLRGFGWSRVPSLRSVCGFILPPQWLAVILASSTLGTTRSALQLEPGQLEVGAHFPFHCSGHCLANWTVSKCLPSEWVTDRLASERVIGPVLFACWSVLTEVGLTLHGNGKNHSSCRVLDLHRRQFVIMAKPRGPSARRTKAIEPQILEVIVHSSATVRQGLESEAILDDIPPKDHGRGSNSDRPTSSPSLCG